MTQNLTENVLKAFDELLRAIQGTRDDIARMDRDLAADRQGNERTAMVVAANTEQLAQLTKRLEIIERKIQDRVAEAMAPAMQEVQDFKEVMRDKKVTAINTQEAKKQIKKHWWMLWKKEGRKE